jgi:hypothetical protein
MGQVTEGPGGVAVEESGKVAETVLPVNAPHRDLDPWVVAAVERGPPLAISTRDGRRAPS